MANTKEAIFLLSSNYTEKYIEDIFEALAMPTGVVIHFRYQLKRLQKELREQLPIEKSKVVKEIKPKTVVVCYLYQDGEEIPVWKSIYPIRMGKIVKAYKTGDEDIDIAHFYFRLDSYVNYEGIDRAKVFSDLVKKSCGKSYALINSSLESKMICNREALLPKSGANEKTAFFKTVEAFDIDDLRFPNGSSFYPLFIKIDDVRDKNGNVVTPSYNGLIKKSIFRLKEYGEYSLNYTTYTPRIIQKAPEFRVSITTDSKVFISPSEFEIRHTSRYDEESIGLVSSNVERTVISLIRFRILSEGTAEDRKPIRLNISIPIEVEKNTAQRLIAFGADTLFAVAATMVALYKNHSQISLGIIIFIYVVWVIVRFTIVVKK